MGGHLRGCDPAGGDLDDEQDVQAVQEDRVGMEEIRASSPSAWAHRKACPGSVRLSGCWAQPTGAQDRPHGRLPQPVAQTDEFAVDPAIPPALVFSDEPADQLPDLAVWTADRAGWGSATCAPLGRVC